METPAPTISNFNLTEEIKDIKEYKINSENESFIVKFGKTNNSEKIIFIIEDSNTLTKFFYKSDFSLDELKNINKLFRIFDSINEAYNEINDILSNKKIIIKRGLNELNLYLSLPSISSKTKDLCLKIKKEDFNNQIVNDIIIKELNEIKKLLMEEKQKNKQLNNIVDELIQEKNQLKIKVEELIKWKESITKQEIKELVNKYKIDSKIITKNEEVELLSNRLTSKGFIKNQKVIFNLIYRASRDGSSPNNYHSKCDGKMNTICIIQTIKGCKLG